MKILYVADNINHHMIPLSNALINELGFENFKYAVLKPMSQIRVGMGFDPNDDKKKWCLRVYENEANLIEYEKWLNSADVVLFSNRNMFNKIDNRLKLNKLTFYFSERWWKPKIGKFRILHPSYLTLLLKFRSLSKNKSFHYLAQGGHAYSDVKGLTHFDDRIWKFGYFTDVNFSKTITKNSKITNILWCGRMLKWKKVDVLIKAFGKVYKNNNNCHLIIIGDGEEKIKLIKLAHKILPLESYTFLKNMPVNEIRENMSQADIYVLPSSGYEGWGAVVNEAMAEGCAVIATKESGSGKAIIQDGKNGLLFKAGDWKSLSSKIELLINDKKLIKQIQENGKIDLKSNWSPEIAAKRLICVSNNIINGNTPVFYDFGPFSKLI